MVGAHRLVRALHDHVAQRGPRVVPRAAGLVGPSRRERAQHRRDHRGRGQPDAARDDRRGVTPGQPRGPMPRPIAVGHQLASVEERGEVVGELAGIRVAVLGRWRQRAHQQRAQLDRDPAPRDDRTGRRPGEREVDQRAQAPHIAGRPRGLAARQLRRAIPRRSTDHAATRGLGERRREPPVHHHDLAVGAEANVVRRQIAVDHAARVGVGHGMRDLEQRAQQRRAPRPPGRARDPLGEAVPAHDAHRVERLLTVAAIIGVEHGDDAGVIEPGGHAGLAQQRRAGRGIALGAHLLDRDLAIEQQIVRGPDPSHRAHPELAAEPVARARAPRRRRRIHHPFAGVPEPLRRGRPVRRGHRRRLPGTARARASRCDARSRDRGARPPRPGGAASSSA